MKASVRETNWGSRGLCPSQRSELLPAYEAGEGRTAQIKEKIVPKTH